MTGNPSKPDECQKNKAASPPLDRRQALAVTHAFVKATRGLPPIDSEIHSSKQH